MRVSFDKSNIRPAARKSARKPMCRPAPQPDHRGDAAVATVWLVFYAFGIAVAVASPFVSRAIELAAR